MFFIKKETAKKKDSFPGIARKIGLQIRVEYLKI
jgi:hypothetical protein